MRCEIPLWAKPHFHSSGYVGNYRLNQGTKRKTLRKDTNNVCGKIGCQADKIFLLFWYYGDKLLSISSSCPFITPFNSTNTIWNRQLPNIKYPISLSCMLCKMFHISSWNTLLFLVFNTVRWKKGDLWINEKINCSEMREIEINHMIYYLK